MSERTAQRLSEFVSTAMSTTVSVQIVGDHAEPATLAAQVFDWFALVEAACSRFDDQSELTALCTRAGAPVVVSSLLFEVLRVALAVAEESGGAFDPTLGAALHDRGFRQHWRGGLAAPPPLGARTGSWTDIVLDANALTVTLPHAMQLDLGAVAKGFALDLSARALAGVADLCIVAGGDLLCRGSNALGMPWRTAVVDPFAVHRAACTIEVDAPEYAVCTSGDYARVSPAGHHLLDPLRPGAPSASALRSVTVVAPQAAIADALATAAFVLGLEQGSALLERQQVDGFFVTAENSRHDVYGWSRSTFSPTHTH